jgi:hypothetical protein
MTVLTYLFILVFLIGLFFYAKCSDPKYVEGLTTNTNSSRCPNLLIQKGSKIYLYNSKLAQVPGVNPIEFENLEDYTEFLDWQRSQGIRCPVLYMQQSYDTQGNSIYKIRPSITEPQGGLPPSITESQQDFPQSIANSTGEIIHESSLDISNGPIYPNPTLLVDATRNDPPYNMNSYPAYDQTQYYIGTTTPLDMMNVKQEKMAVSPDPMDPNWGGEKYTQDLVNKGYYAENNVAINIP